MVLTQRSRDDERIGEMLTACQERDVEAAAHQLMIERRVAFEQFEQAFEVMSCCVVQPQYFVEYGNRFYPKLLAVQEAIRQEGLDAIQEMLAKDLFRFAA